MVGETPEENDLKSEDKEALEGYIVDQ